MFRFTIEFWCFARRSKPNKSYFFYYIKLDVPINLFCIKQDQKREVSKGGPIFENFCFCRNNPRRYVCDHENWLFGRCTYDALMAKFEDLTNDHLGIWLTQMNPFSKQLGGQSDSYKINWAPGFGQGPLPLSLGCPQVPTFLYIY
jgi:hypothetical protein